MQTITIQKTAFEHFYKRLSETKQYWRKLFSTITKMKKKIKLNSLKVLRQKQEKDNKNF